MSAGEVVRREERARREQEALMQGEGYRGSLEDQTDLQYVPVSTLFVSTPDVGRRRLARELQEEEDRLVAESYRDQEQQHQRRENVQLDPAVRARAAPRPEQEEARPGKVKKDKKGKKDCVVM
jgi:hypothetical protein